MYEKYWYIVFFVDSNVVDRDNYTNWRKLNAALSYLDFFNFLYLKNNFLTKYKKKKQYTVCVILSIPWNKHKKKTPQKPSFNCRQLVFNSQLDKSICVTMLFSLQFRESYNMNKEEREPTDSKPTNKNKQTNISN